MRIMRPSRADKINKDAAIL